MQKLGRIVSRSTLVILAAFVLAFALTSFSAKYFSSQIASKEVSHDSAPETPLQSQVVSSEAPSLESSHVSPPEPRASRPKDQSTMAVKSKPSPVTRPAVSSTYREDGFERNGSNIRLTKDYRNTLLLPENMADHVQAARVEPHIVENQIRGFRLARIREASIFYKAGFQNGDIIEEINGVQLRDPLSAISLLQQIRTAEVIRLRLKRGGRLVNMHIQVDK